MSIQQLEQRVRSLSPDEFVKFSQWFDAYRTTTEAPGTSTTPNCPASNARRSTAGSTR